MGFSHGYGEAPLESEAIELIRSAVELIPKDRNFTLTPQKYMDLATMKSLLARQLDPSVIATKLFLLDSHNIEHQIRDHLTKSMRRMNTDFVEVYCLHRLLKILPLEKVAVLWGSSSARRKSAVGV